MRATQPNFHAADGDDDDDDLLVVEAPTLYVGKWNKKPVKTPEIEVKLP